MPVMKSANIRNPPTVDSLYQLIISENAYKFTEEPVELSSGEVSNHYFDMKKITLLPKGMEMIYQRILTKLYSDLKHLDIEGFGGPEFGALPIIFYLCTKLPGQVFPIVVRKEAKDHGTKQKVEGRTDLIKNIVLIEDVCTSGQSALKAIAALREAGMNVDHCICLVDRQEGAHDALAKQGVTLISLFVKADFTK